MICVIMHLISDTSLKKSKRLDIYIYIHTIYYNPIINRDIPMGCSMAGMIGLQFMHKKIMLEPSVLMDRKYDHSLRER